MKVRFKNASHRVIVRVAVLVVLRYVAEIREVVLNVTEFVVMVKLAVVAPDTTVTLAGTVAFVPDRERVTTAPEEGADPVSVTVPVDDAPPFTLAGLRVRVESAGGLTVSVADFELPLYEAEIATPVAEATGFVETVNVAVVALDATATV